MPRKRWGGDATHRLPAGQIEPYRLWFEFLRLALKDKTLRKTFKRDMYMAWGDVTKTTFKDWWGSHWRELFAEPRRRSRSSLKPAQGYKDIKPTARSIRSPEDLRSIGRHETAFVVATDVPLHVALTQVKRLLKSMKADTTRSVPFRIDEGVSIKLAAMRIMLRLYGRSIDFCGDVEKVARDYAGWAQSWKVSARRGNRRTINTAVMTSYVEHLDGLAAARESGKGVTRSTFVARSGSNTSGMDNMRRQIVRYIRKGRRIAGNVAKGRFPGKYGE